MMGTVERSTVRKHLVRPLHIFLSSRIHPWQLRSLQRNGWHQKEVILFEYRVVRGSQSAHQVHRFTVVAQSMAVTHIGPDQGEQFRRLREFVRALPPSTVM